MGRCLEFQTNASVKDATVQWSPRIDGPSAIYGAIRAEQRIPASLMNVREILHIYEKLERTDRVLGQKAEQDVRFRFGAEGVVFKTLIPRVVALDADTTDFFLFPHPDESEALARRQRSVDAFTELKLPRVHVGVAERGREGGFS